MVMSVAGASSPKKIGVMDKVTQEQLYSQGRYSSPVVIVEESPKTAYRQGDSFIRFLGKLVLTAAAICGGAVAIRKWVPAMQKESIDVTQKLDSTAKPLEKIKYYIAKFADWITDEIKDIFTRKKPKDADSAKPEK